MANSISRQLIVDEAIRRGWSVDTFGSNEMYYRITTPSGRSEIMRGTRPMSSSANGAVIAKYKHITLAFCESIGYRVPSYCLPADGDQAVAFLQEHGTIVVKPIDAEQSKGVTVGVTDKAGLTKALAVAEQYAGTGKAMLQQQLQGNLYRLMVIDGWLVGAIHRKAAEVVGNGTDSVERLIELANQDPRRSAGNTTALKRISVPLARDYLGVDGLRCVPAKGVAVRVCAIDSVSAGGEAVNVTDSIHPSWRRAAVDIARQAGLFVCGFDVMCDDIAHPLGDTVPILELNSMPGLKLLHYPTAGGEPIDAAALLLDAVFVPESLTPVKDIVF